MIKNVSKQNFFQTVVNQLNNFFDINVRVIFLRNHVFFRRIIFLFIIVFMNVKKKLFRLKHQQRQTIEILNQKCRSIFRNIDRFSKTT